MRGRGLANFLVLRQIYQQTYKHATHLQSRKIGLRLGWVLWFSRVSSGKLVMKKGAPSADRLASYFSLPWFGGHSEGT